jgi:coenzyme F420-reducing hydrogenase delta subunit
MKPKTVIFFCNWSAYPGLQLSENIVGESDSVSKMLVTMCSGRISPELILEAFYRGAWGVLITACPKDSCEHDGNYKTTGRIALLKMMLTQLGVDSKRLKMEWVDKGEVSKLKQAVDTFVNEMSHLGPVNS